MADLPSGLSLAASDCPGDDGEPNEAQQALRTVSQALSQLKEHKTVTWLLDSDFEDTAVWSTNWEQQEHLLVRLYHTDRTIAFREWHQGDITQATTQLRPLAQVETNLEVKRGKQVPRVAQRDSIVEQEGKKLIEHVF